MPICTLLGRVALLVGAHIHLAGLVPAQHSYISVEPWLPAKGAEIQVAVTTDGDGAAFSSPLAGPLMIVGPNQRDLQETEMSHWRATPSGFQQSFTAERPGTYILAMSSGLIPTASGPMVHHMKAAVQVDDLLTTGWKPRLYQPLELVPVFCPTANAPNQKVLLRLDFKGQGLAHHPAKYLRVDEAAGPGVVKEVMSGPVGVVQVPVDAPGHWLVSAEHTEPVAEAGQDRITHRASFSLWVRTREDADRVWDIAEDGGPSPVRSVMGYGFLVLLLVLLVGPLAWLVRGLRQ